MFYNARLDPLPKLPGLMVATFPYQPHSQQHNVADNEFILPSARAIFEQTGEVLLRAWPWLIVIVRSAGSLEPSH